MNYQLSNKAKEIRGGKGGNSKIIDLSVRREKKKKDDKETKEGMKEKQENDKESEGGMDYWWSGKERD